MAREMTPVILSFFFPIVALATTSAPADGASILPWVRLWITLLINARKGLPPTSPATEVQVSNGAMAAAGV